MGGGTYVKVDSTRNNSVGKITSHTIAAPGSVKRLTVAVVLDAKAAADVTAIQQLVGNAVGINAQRGDSVQVNKIAFDTSVAATAAKELKDAQAAAKTAQYIDLGKKAGLALLAVLFAVVLMRRSRRNNPPPAQIEAVASDLPPGIAGGPVHPSLLPNMLEEQLAISAAGHQVLLDNSEIIDPSLERELLKNEVAKFVDQQPEEIAIIVQSWLGQRKG